MHLHWNRNKENIVVFHLFHFSTGPLIHILLKLREEFLINKVFCLLQHFLLNELTVAYICFDNTLLHEKRKAHVSRRTNNTVTILNVLKLSLTSSCLLVACLIMLRCACMSPLLNQPTHVLVCFVSRFRVMVLVSFVSPMLLLTTFTWAPKSRIIF